MSEATPLSKEIDLTGSHWFVTWVKNARLNGLLDPPIRSINDLPFEDRETLVVCGSGPSLDADIEKLRYDPSIIIANHSNLATLLYFDIIPDYVLITDAGKATYDRLANDVLPHFDAVKECKFILPTHADNGLVKLLRMYLIEPYFFPNISFSLHPTPEMERYNDILQLMTPSLERFDADGNGSVDCLVQCGCVSNASVVFATYLWERFNVLKTVYLSGVDFSFPNGKNRCTVVTWNKDKSAFYLTINPSRHDLDPPLLTLGGIATDAAQFGYYNDLKYIAAVVKQNAMFDLFTTSRNFVSDFLEVKTL